MKKDHHGASGAEPRASSGLDLLGANSEIGKKLREYYDGLVAQEVPDRFSDLLSKLEQAESGKRPGSGE